MDELGPGVTRRGVVMYALDESGMGVPIDAELEYDLREPYAVRAHFILPEGDVVEWAFARELLADGLDGIAGLGDVRVLRYPAGADQLVLSLDCGAGTALLLVSVLAVEAFLECSFVLCPAGQEDRFVDVDAALAGWLRP